MAASLEMVAVVAMARNRVIGDGAGLIWHLPADLKRVKSLTMGCPLIMGRRTWDSIGRALPGRASVVMTRDATWAAEGALRAGDMDAALALSRDWITATDGARPEIILFGGGEIYAKALSDAERLYLTEVHADIDGDTFFPALDRGLWREKSRNSHAADGDKPGFDFILLER